jgi:sulfur-oxidizing protein SoxZ
LQLKGRAVRAVAQLEVRIAAPSTARVGEVIEIKTLALHPMEHGFRLDPEGNPVARKILNAFFCKYNGEVIFAVDLHPAMAANPYLVFHAIATKSGTLEFTWREDGGDVFVSTKTIAVS